MAPTKLLHTGEPFDPEVDYTAHRDLARFQEPADLHTAEHAALTATDPSLWECFTDISKYQDPYDSRYKQRIMSFRIDSGYSIDSKAKANLAEGIRHLDAGTARLLILYVVHIPGNNTEMMARVQALLNGYSEAHRRRMVIMIDEESGPGFAGPGDHSDSFNSLALAFAQWFGKIYTPTFAFKHVWVYANSYDRSECLPRLDPRFTIEVRASWGSRDPGTYAQQYRGGTNTPVPPGCPTSIAPYSNVDLNVIRRSMAQIELDLGIVVPAPPENNPLETLMATWKDAPSSYAQFRADLKEDGYNADRTAMHDAIKPQQALWTLGERIRSPFLDGPVDKGGKVRAVTTLLARAGLPSPALVTPAKKTTLGVATLKAAGKRPEYVVNAAKIGAVINTIVMVLGFLGYESWGQQLSTLGTVIASTVMGLLIIGFHLFPALYARFHVTPVDDPMNNAGQRLVPEDTL